MARCGVVKPLPAVGLVGLMLLFLPPQAWADAGERPGFAYPSTIGLIDDFDGGITNWWPPDRSGTFSGVVIDETTIAAAMIDQDRDRARGHPHGSGGAMRLDFRWDTEIPFLEPVAGGAGSHLLRLHMPHPVAAQPHRRFGPGQALEVFVLGDGSENRFRLLIRDGRGQLEGSRWYTVDWDGWQRIVWDFNRDPVQGWVNGDGRVDGETFHFDSFLITMDAAGNASGGRLYFDGLRAIPAGPRPDGYQKSPTSPADTTGADPGPVPSALPGRWLRERRQQPR